MSKISKKNYEISPYAIFENDYWSQPRDVCVVQEIKCLPGEDAEVICGIDPRDEQWTRRLAGLHGFDVKREEKPGRFGPYLKFTVRRKK